MGIDQFQTGRGIMKECGCKPGTPDNGWKEVRSNECIRREIESWGRITAWMRNGERVKSV
jgi:hypothetical protein